MLTTSSNAALQLEADAAFHGRVMAVYSMLFVGMKGVGGLVGGPIAGVSPRAGIAVGAVACLAAALWAARRERPGTVPSG
ncbi:MAG: hypothetical protein ACRD2C_17995 [Acidimicrobiales bacterium]